MKRISIKNSDLRVLKPKYIFQRARYGFCERDAVFIQRWFCQIMPEMLEYMADNLLSYPGCLEQEYLEQHKEELGVPSYLDLITRGRYKELREKVADEVSAQWQQILRRMAHLFRESFDGTLPDEEKTDEENDFEKLQQYEENCAEEALELFSKWFFNLWCW